MNREEFQRRLEAEHEFFRLPIGAVFTIEGEWVEHRKLEWACSVRADGVHVSWVPRWVYRCPPLMPWDRAGERFTTKREEPLWRSQDSSVSPLGESASRSTANRATT